MSSQAGGSSGDRTPRGGDLGGWLRAAREARGIPLLDVAQQTRVKLSYLELIEANRTDELPAEVFVRGFVRAYARAIGADDRVAAQMLSQHLLARREGSEESSERGRGRAGGLLRSPLGVLVMVGTLVAVLVIGLLVARR